MKVLVIGGGGREHAIVEKISQNPKVTQIFALPGNAGMQQKAECFPIKATDIEGIVRFALENKVDFAVVTPDDPLVLGAAGRLREAGLRCFGPSAAAAAIEGSKVFAKELMEKHEIPTARCRVFSDAAKAAAYAESGPFPIVIKADGLALGKGVLIAEDRQEACEAVNKIMCERAFGKSGERVVIEEFLTGPEVSVLAITDGKTLLPLASSMDHKRAYDGDVGPNTGGMGIIAPNPWYTKQVEAECMERIFLPTLAAMRAEGRPFSGCLYFGLMLTEQGPKVIEYNCRFGDPETQAVLSLLNGDLLELMLAAEAGELAGCTVAQLPGASCCVVLSSKGYPTGYETGYEIEMNGAEELLNVSVYHAGTRYDNGRLVTAGGRVLGVTAWAQSAEEAVKLAYQAADRITFFGKTCRRDIGARALQHIRETEGKRGE